eukprot:gene13666-16094_t
MRIILFAMLAVMVVVASAGSHHKYNKKVKAGTTCRGVTFSGAGDRGAYEAGVLWGLSDMRSASDQAWQVVTGISAGAINAAGFAQFNVGDEKAGVQYLVDRWNTINAASVYKDWFGGPIDGLLLRQGIYDTTPLEEYLTANLNVSLAAASNRQLLIGATNLDTGIIDFFNNTESHLVLAVKASSSIPGIFPPTTIRGNTYVDGGATYMTPITDTARLCYDTGATEVILDAIIDGSMNKFDNVTGLKTIPLLLRSGAIVSTNIFAKDVETTFQAFPDVKINVFTPSQPLPGNALDFLYCAEMIPIGYKDASSESNIVLTRHNYKLHLGL